MYDVVSVFHLNIELLVFFNKQYQITSGFFIYGNFIENLFRQIGKILGGGLYLIEKLKKWERLNRMQRFNSKPVCAAAA